MNRFFKILGRIIWRTFETLLCIFIFLLTLPFFLLAILLIQMDSPGEIIYSQKRVGKNGRIFDLYKLRTMKKGADGENPPHTQVNDPRFSRLCRFIRATTIDEIPQLYNVLVGDMSLIGPRPERPQVVETYTERQMNVLNFVPGLFGISQLAFREGVVVDQKLDLEVSYYPHRSAFTDAKILLYTPYIIFWHSISKINGNSNGCDRLKMVRKAFIKNGNGSDPSKLKDVKEPSNGGDPEKLAVSENKSHEKVSRTQPIVE